MKTLKGLSWPERQRRHRIIMDIFHAHDRDDLPWMSRASANDPEKIIEITEKIREPVEVYSWFSRGNWVCVSINQISQCIDGNFNFVQFGANAINKAFIPLTHVRHSTNQNA
jgi:hypothetical protein